MTPDFLNKFKPELEKFQKETIKIEAIPVDESTKITASKFLGKPYLPKEAEYPKDKKGNPMILWAQINFSEVPELENYPTSGILQFYVAATNWYDTNNYKIMFHEEVKEEFQTNFTFLTEDLYKESPIDREHQLKFVKQIDFGGTEDNRFSMRFDGKEFWEFNDTLLNTEREQIEKLFDGAGHKIGGYAYFTQGDPREYNKGQKDDLLLLQIDTDENIMFGDSGVANFFINDQDLINKDFSKAWFYWDCC